MYLTINLKYSIVKSLNTCIFNFVILSFHEFSLKHGLEDQCNGFFCNSVHISLVCTCRSLQVVKCHFVLTVDRYGSDASIVCESDEFPDAIVHMSKHLDLVDSEMQEIYDPYQGNSPLIQACREHHHDITREILKSDPDINYSNTAGNTALHVAAKSESRSTYTDKKMMRFPLSGDLRIVELLINSGCNINLMNHQGDTPLKRAVDGIREIFSWSFTIEDRIQHAIVFCDIVSVLTLAGCNLELRYHSESVLSILLGNASSVCRADSQTLMTKYVTSLLHLLAAGVEPSVEDLHRLYTLPSPSPQLTDALSEVSEKPRSLKTICKLSVRRYMREPFRKNISHLSLPRSLKDYVDLKTNV